MFRCTPAVHLQNITEFAMLITVGTVHLSVKKNTGKLETMRFGGLLGALEHLISHCV